MVVATAAALAVVVPVAAATAAVLAVAAMAAALVAVVPVAVAAVDTAVAVPAAAATKPSFEDVGLGQRNNQGPSGPFFYAYFCGLGAKVACTRPVSVSTWATLS